VCGGKGYCLFSVVNTTVEVGSCVCNQSATTGFWQGSACDDCNYAYSGNDCKALCGNGQCNPTTSLCDGGKTGSGKCVCSFGFGGSTCTSQCPKPANGGVCGGGYYGKCNKSTSTCECDTSTATLSNGICVALPGKVDPRDPDTTKGAPTAAVITIYIAGDISSVNKTDLILGLWQGCGGCFDLKFATVVLTPASVKADLSISSATGAPDVTSMKSLVDALNDPATKAVMAKRLNLDPSFPVPTGISYTYSNATTPVPPKRALLVSSAPQYGYSVIAIIATAVLSLIAMA
jgi:hypothetical protein